MDIQKRDVSILRKLTTPKTSCVFRMASAYVSSGNVIHTDFGLMPEMDEKVLHRYLQIAKKSVSGILGDTLLEMVFEKTREADQFQKELLSIRDSELKDERLLLPFYEAISENYSTEYSNYMIFLFYGAYDIPIRGKDRRSQDESEESYRFLFVCLCPVDMSKPGLSYDPDEKRIEESPLFWQIKNPECAFLYPSLSGRHTDIDHVIHYLKKKVGKTELAASVFHCSYPRTKTDEENTLEQIFVDAFPDLSDKDAALLKTQRKLYLDTLTEEGKIDGNARLTEEMFEDIIDEIGVGAEDYRIKDELIRGFQDNFADDPPLINSFVSNSFYDKNEDKLTILDLHEKVSRHEKQIQEGSPGVSGVRVGIDPERVGSLSVRAVNGKPCLVIPLIDDEVTTVNNIPFDFN